VTGMAEPTSVACGGLEDNNIKEMEDVVWAVSPVIMVGKRSKAWHLWSTGGLVRTCMVALHVPDDNNKVVGLSDFWSEYGVRSKRWWQRSGSRRTEVASDAISLATQRLCTTVFLKMIWLWYPNY
jgi:hypothetical protein